MRAAAGAALLAVALAGCLGSSGSPPPGAPEPARPLAGDCALPGAAPIEQGACAWFFDPTDGPDREAHLAVHPSDPGTVLVTWREGEIREGPRIYAAVTRDAGAGWRVERLTDPSLRALETPRGGRYAFDSVAAFGPGGEAYVLFGGEITNETTTGARTSTRMTLATSTDGGSTWAYHRFQEMPDGPMALDYMDLAVAPDSGHLYVVAQTYPTATFRLGSACAAAPCFLPTGVWLWRSDDGGATWEVPRPVLRSVPGVYGHFAPRVAAGPGGFVLVTANWFDETTGERRAVVSISRDGARAFGEPAEVYRGQEGDRLLSDPVALWVAPDGGLLVTLVYAVADGLLRLTSQDGGATWGEGVRFAPLPAGMAPGWAMAAAGPDGTVAALQRFGRDEPSRFGLALHRVLPDGQEESLVLVDALGHEGEHRVGDDYGGLGVDAAGRLWAAWADPRGGQPRIALARAV